MDSRTFLACVRTRVLCELCVPVCVRMCLGARMCAFMIYCMDALHLHSEPNAVALRERMVC